jgi:transposase-like protein
MDSTVTCPFCEANQSEMISLFGSQLLFSQYRCGSCGSYFEGLREDRCDPQPAVPTTEGGQGDGGRAQP